MTKRKKSLELLGYVRVSQVAGREGDSFIAPAVQRERIQHFAASHGHKIIGWHEDLDESGGKLDRPEFQKALKGVEEGKSNGIIVAKLDRFARSVAGAAQAIERLEAAGGALLSVDLGMDTSTPQGRLMQNVLMALAEFELDRFRESWQTAKLHAVNRGVYPGRWTPPGYTKTDEGKLKKHTGNAKIVKGAFQRRGKREPIQSIVRFLNASGLLNAAGNKTWTMGSLNAMLKNRVYLGEVNIGGGQIIKKAHEAIVTEAEWRAAQATHSFSVSPDPRPLSGLLRCQGCRYVLKKILYNDGKEEKTYVFGCRRNHASGACPAPAYVMEHLAEEWVVQKFFESLEDGVLAKSVPDSDELEAAQLVLVEAQAELDAWVTSTSISQLGEKLYLSGLEHRQQAVEKAEDRLHTLIGTSDSLTDVNDLRGTWDDLSGAEKQRILGAGIDAVFLRREDNHTNQYTRAELGSRAHIFWRGEGPDDLPRKGRLLPITSLPWPDDTP